MNANTGPLTFADVEGLAKEHREQLDDIARDMKGFSVPSLIQLALHECVVIEDGNRDLYELLDAALDSLPNSDDSDRAKALLNACVALHERQHYKRQNTVWAAVVSMALRGAEDQRKAVGAT